MEPRVVRTLKKTFEESHYSEEAEKRKQISDDILDIIYSKVLAKHEKDKKIGRGVRALIEDNDEDDKD
jgi:hypothetical protein